ncbi:MAG: hypothetical protein IJR46_01525 [Neisseriaceae bacterium]|nr:hypothetical protein [Neisseriaceae bacterium]
MGPTSPEVKAEYEAVGAEKEAAMKEFEAITEQYIAETGITPEPLVLVH